MKQLEEYDIEALMAILRKIKDIIGDKEIKHETKENLKKIILKHRQEAKDDIIDRIEKAIMVTEDV